MTPPVATTPPMPRPGMTATERAAVEMQRREWEQVTYGTRPAQGVMDATLEAHDPNAGAGYTAADDVALVVDKAAKQAQQIADLGVERLANRDTIHQLQESLAANQLQLEALQGQYAALLAEAEFDFLARIALHSQVCRYGQALTLIANLPIAEDGYRAAQQLRTARLLADKAIHVAAVPARPAVTIVAAQSAEHGVENPAALVRNVPVAS